MLLKVEHTTLCLESKDRTGTSVWRHHNHSCHHHRRHRHRHPNRRRYGRCHRYPTLKYNSIIISKVVTQCDM